MDSVSIIASAPRSGGANSPAQSTAQTDNGVGARFDAQEAEKQSRVEVKVKSQSVDKIKDQSPKQKNVFGVNPKEENIIDGGTQSQIDDAKVKMSAALNKIEASIAAILTRSGVPYPDVRTLSAGNIMVQVPPDFMENLSSIIGVFIAEFDQLNGTNFAMGLQMIAASLSANGKLDLNLEGVDLNNPYQVIDNSLGLIAAAMGVDRPTKDNSITQTQLTAMVEKSIGRGMAANPAMETGKTMGETIPVSNFSDKEASGVIFSGKGDRTSPEDIVRNFLRDVSKAGEFAAAANKNVSALKALGMGRDLNVVRKDNIATKLEVQDNIQQVQTSNYAQKDFENMILRVSSLSAPGSDLTQSNQVARFSNLINSQIKNASWNENQARVQLSPRGLGDIEVDVMRDNAGNLKATVRVENPLVLEMLREEKNGLQALLENNGFNLSDADLEFEEFEDETGEESIDSGNGEISSQSNLYTSELSMGAIGRDGKSVDIQV